MRQHFSNFGMTKLPCHHDRSLKLHSCTPTLTINEEKNKTQCNLKTQQNNTKQGYYTVGACTPAQCQYCAIACVRPACNADDDGTCLTVTMSPCCTHWACICPMVACKSTSTMDGTSRIYKIYDLQKGILCVSVAFSPSVVVLAPACSSNCTVSGRPSMAARCRAVLPWWSFSPSRCCCQLK